MTTQITTLEQAELVLRRNNAVVVHNEADFVEGKQLLDICGFSYTDRNWGSVLERQFNRHNFVEGTDYTKTRAHTVVGAGNRGVRTTTHVTINAANHILLAAMTNEGREARQEAIDMRTQQQQQEQQQQPTSNLLLNALLETQRQLDSQAAQVAQVEQTLETHAAQIATIMGNEVPEGCLTVSEIHERYASFLSEAKVRSVLSGVSWPHEQFTAYIHGTRRDCKAYKVELARPHWSTVSHLEDLFSKIRREARLVTNYYYEHDLVTGRFTMNF